MHLESDSYSRTWMLLPPSCSDHMRARKEFPHDLGGNIQDKTPSLPRTNVSAQHEDVRRKVFNFTLVSFNFFNVQF